MISLNSFSQDLIARQAPIDKKLKSVDSLALQKQIRAEQSEYPALSLYQHWNNQYAHSYGKDVIIPETYTIDLTGFCMPTPSTRITSPFGPRWRRMHNGLDLKVNIGDTIVAAFDGKVRIVKYERRGYGKYIVIRHDNGWNSSKRENYSILRSASNAVLPAYSAGNTSLQFLRLE